MQHDNNINPYSLIAIWHCRFTERGIFDPNPGITGEFLAQNFPNRIVIRHSLLKGPSQISFYQNNHIIKTIDIKWVKYLPVAIKYFVEPVITAWYLIKYGKNTTIFSIDPLSSFIPCILKSVGYVKKVFFLTPDFSDKQRFKNPVLNSIYFAIDKFCTQTADSNICNSNAVIELKQRHYPKAKPDQFFHMPNIPPASLVEKYKDAAKVEGRILYVGDLSADSNQNGLLTLFTVIEQLKPEIEELHLVIVGDGAKKSFLQKQAEGIEGITFLGQLDYDKALHEVAKAQIGVALYNGQNPYDKFRDSLKIREYQAFGTIAIVSNVATSNAQEIKRHHSGIVIENLALDSLKSHIHHILTDKTYHQTLVANAKHNHQIHAKAYEKLKNLFQAETLPKPGFGQKLPWLVPVSLYILAVLAVSWKLLPWNGIINYTDIVFTFNPKQNFQNVFSTWSPMMAGHDMSFIMSSSALSALLSLALNYFVTNPNIASYIMAFGKVFLALFVSHIVLKKMFKDQALALLLPLLLLFNNFTLESFYSGAQEFVSLGYIATCLVIYNLFKIWHGQVSAKRMFYLALSCLVAFHPFIFVALQMMILFYFGILLVASKINKRQILIAYALFLVFSLLLNAYWLLPFIYSSLSVSNDTIHGALNNEAVFSAYTNISNNINDFSFIAFFGDISQKLYFSSWQYAYYFFLAIGLVLPLIKKKVDGFTLFLYACLFILFDLAKGPRGIVTGPGFLWLWSHVSFFSFFRSFKRFYILVPALYIFIIAFGLQNFKKYKHYALMLLVALAILVHYPMLSGNVFGSILPLNIPQSYQDFNATLGQDADQYNVLSLPYNAYEWYNWTETPNKNIISPDMYWINYYLVKPDVTLRDATYLVNYSGQLQGINEGIWQGDSIGNNLTTLNIKYILVHKDLVDRNRNPIEYRGYENYLENRGYIITQSNEYFDVFLNQNYVPQMKVFSDQLPQGITMTKVTPDKYIITIPARQVPSIVVNFKENYSSNWKLYPKDMLSKVSLFDAQYVFEKDLYPYFHDTYNNFGNSWTMPTATSASIDSVQLVLFFKPQGYLVLGSWISGLTLLVFVGALIYKKKP